MAFFSSSKILVTDEWTDYFIAKIANLFIFSGIKYLSSYHHHTPWAAGLIENLNKHLDWFLRTTNKTKFIGQTKQKFKPLLITNSQFSPYEMVFKRKTRMAGDFNWETTRDQKSICTNFFADIYQPTPKLL